MSYSNKIQNTSRIIRAPEVCKRTGLSLSWIHELMSKGDFPKNFKIVTGGRASGWYENEIEDWVNSRREGGNENAKV